MVKKSGAILLALLYTITVAGFALNLHYCGNHVANVQINAPAKSCAKETTKGKMNCCKDTRLDVKVKDDQQQPTSFLLKLFAVELPRYPLADFLLPVQQELLEKYFDRGPPDSPDEGIPVFLKNCTFRI